MKKLVFNFYITKDWRENKIYNIHFNCLKYYRNCFDEAYFALVLEDPSDLVSLTEVKQKLLNIFDNLTRIEFETVKNDIYCEATTFKKEIIDKLENNELVFFAHTKGVTNVKSCKNQEILLDWIYALYYFSLSCSNEPQGLLMWAPDHISYGPLLIESKIEPKYFNTYGWRYMGTFFWINSKRLASYIKMNNIEIPIINDRFYVENFLGNIYPIRIDTIYDGNILLASTYKELYFILYTPDGLEIVTPSIENCLQTEEDREDFENFKQFISNNIQ